MVIYIVVYNDRHEDIEVKPFLELDDAINYARREATKNTQKYPEDYQEIKVEGYLFHVQYSCEGDYLAVTKHEL